MQSAILGLVYLMFFLSGVSALIYEVAWVRSFSLVFGGSHLAVTTVLSVFMGGLALGSYLFGNRADVSRKPFRLYGLLEIGISLSAVLFILLMKVYPLLYVPLARVTGDTPVLLSLLRVLFAGVAMIVPTTLMGGTLPVLSRFVAARRGLLGNRLSFLYGINTLGAVTGTLAAGFYLLPSITLTGTLAVAMSINACIGGLAILLQDKTSSLFPEGPRFSEEGPGPGKECRGGSPTEGHRPLPVRMVLLGIGISGFCALGYEVLWTRVLAMVVGASVYGFTIMLAAFLTGIAAGSGTYGLYGKVRGEPTRAPEISMAWFGALQVVIGLAALAVTYFIRDLPSHSIRIQNYLLGTGTDEFGVRLGANFAVAFSHMFLPAFFMGIAFPLAGKIRAEYGKSSGEAVGEVAAYNTVGAILGAGISGFALVYLFGIERSLQFLTLVNVGAGAVIVLSSRRTPLLAWGAAAAVAAVIVALAVRPGLWRLWDLKYFAIYRNNTREAFGTAFDMKDAMENTDVLYYAEGVQATVSAIKVKGGSQAFITNGRIEASNQKEGMQCQYTLGHLPMLLHKAPKKIFVLGTGSGMTLGAISVHPGVKEIVLAEIEPEVLGVARTFSRYNHDVLHDPRLRIVENDGRNYLMTTKETFDVITADPIHPWFSGAGYLYTAEYFRLAAEHLRPGGIICQWLPIYELSTDDLKCVVKTFSENFRYTMLWLTRNDAELVGSNDPIVIDEKELGRRIAAPGVVDDLKSVDMGSADDFLDYFVMGTRGMAEFGAGGVRNTDDNLHLEFSAPMSMDVPTQGENALALYRFRESLLPYLLPAAGVAARDAQVEKWDRNLRAGEAYSMAHVLFLRGGYRTTEFSGIMRELDRTRPDYAPFRFLKGEVRDLAAMTPTLILSERFPLLNESGTRVIVEMSAVEVRIGEERAAVVFADNRTRTIYGQKYIDAKKEALEESVRRYAGEVLSSLRTAYGREPAFAARDGKAYPLMGTTLRKMREIIRSSTGSS